MNSFVRESISGAFFLLLAWWWSDSVEVLCVFLLTGYLMQTFALAKAKQNTIGAIVNRFNSKGLRLKELRITEDNLGAEQ